jgi:hypothetical protein
LLIFALAIVALSQQAQRSPSDTVREFYKAMREKRFREAFDLSIYKPAIDPLKKQEFEDLRPDFEKMAAVIPDAVNITGEQISGDIATVFVKIVKDSSPLQVGMTESEVLASLGTPDKKDSITEATRKVEYWRYDAKKLSVGFSNGRVATIHEEDQKGPLSQSEPVMLMRANNIWIIGDKENQDIVKKAGRQFFFNARIDAHHNDVQDMLTRISLAQLVYSQQHNGLFGDLATLIAAGLVPKDLEGTESTGYRFHINSVNGGKSWNAAAEPAQYGRTGKLSFYLDAAGVRSGDKGGKALTP